MTRQDRDYWLGCEDGQSEGKPELPWIPEYMHGYMMGLDIARRRRIRKALENTRIPLRRQFQ